MGMLDIENFTTEDLSTEKIDRLIKSRKSFQLVAIKDMSYIVNKIEGAIEKQNLSCRIYTGYRGAIAGATGVSGFIGGGSAAGGALATVAATAGLAVFAASVAAGVATRIHRLATYNPDYEIEKDIFNKSIKVIYQRDTIKQDSTNP